MTLTDTRYKSRIHSKYQPRSNDFFFKHVLRIPVELKAGTKTWRFDNLYKGHACICIHKDLIHVAEESVNLSHFFTAKTVMTLAIDHFHCKRCLTEMINITLECLPCFTKCHRVTIIMCLMTEFYSSTVLTEDKFEDFHSLTKGSAATGYCK